MMHTNSPWPGRRAEARRRRLARAAVGQAGRMTTGTVTWFDADKGFGFLTPDDGGPDIFVHFSAIEVDGYRVLEQGQRIEYDVRDGDRGPQAQHVRPLDPDAEPAGRDHGVVSWFDADKGFGFLTPDAGGADLFVHFSEIAADGYRTLEPGQHVEYDVKQSDRGPQAAQVLPVDADAPGQQAPERSSAPRQDDEVVMTGVLSWLAGDKGYGFLTPDDLFVHVSALGDVAEGDRVAFVVRQGERGPQAEQVGPAPGAGRAERAPRPPAGGAGAARTGGTVSWFDVTKGFGFLAPEQGGGDVFVHASEIAEVDGHRTLTEGERVEFGVRQGDRGPQAQDVRRLTGAD